MRAKRYRFSGCIAALALFTVLGLPPSALRADSPTRLPADEIKAGFIYNFLLFAELPDTGKAGNADFLRIGILGDGGIEEALAPLEDMLVGGRGVCVVQIKEDATAEELSACDLLFIPSAAQASVSRILTRLNRAPVITVGEDPRFLENGGMINFVSQAEHVKFEVNAMAAEQCGIRFRAKMLRLAVRVLSATNTAERVEGKVD